MNKITYTNLINDTHKELQKSSLITSCSLELLDTNDNYINFLIT